MSVVYWLLGAAVTVMAVAAALHALLHKSDPRAAFGWVAVCLMFPLAGPALYYLFGINRIRTRARKLGVPPAGPEGAPAQPPDPAVAAYVVDPARLRRERAQVARVAEAIARHPLLDANRVEPLFDGEQAYPAMLEAIAGARRRVYLETYLFMTDVAGQRFVAALAEARRRGVDVRVIVDGVGELYGLPRRVGPALERAGVPVARFLPPRLVPPSVYVNLRTHRKILVVDGEVGFTGGMNIAERHLVAEPEPPPRHTDVHFRLRGPVVSQLEEAFLDDWAFCTGDEAPPPAVPARAAPGGRALCRTVLDGPHEDVNRLVTLLVAVFAAARERLLIHTPYFLPTREMIAALQTAALRGVRVDVVLPERSNLPYVDWATRKMLWEVVGHGVRVHYRPAPFAHAKLVLADDHYALIGSANLDPRSLRLNFELMVEVYDRGLSRTLIGHLDEVIGRSRPVSLDELERRPLGVRTRDALAWLFSPYL